MLVRLVSEPVAAPAQCKMCGAGSQSEGREWWIDTGTIEEFYGRVYFCSVCFTEMAQLVGFLGPAKREQLETKVREAHDELAALKESVAALGTIGLDLNTLSEFASSHYVSLEGEEGRLSELVERAAVASEQIDEQRSAIVSDPKPGRSKSPKISIS